ncbi:MAG: hypothetical protein M1838_002901 [Thelocarpon superellum]|nr:MAG: hypothetical protein M1838_002901 [Thelocarpon superellum]
MLRKATKVASSCLDCHNCATSSALAIQNTMLLGTVLPTIADGYAKMATWIDEDAKRHDERGEMRVMRVSDVARESLGLRAGSPDCPLGVTLRMEPQEWRRMTRRVIQYEMAVSRDDEFGESGFMEVLVRMEKRLRKLREEMNRAHAAIAAGDPAAQFPPSPAGASLFASKPCTGGVDASGNPLCVKLMESVSHVAKNIAVDV